MTPALIRALLLAASVAFALAACGDKTASDNAAPAGTAASADDHDHAEGEDHDAPADTQEGKAAEAEEDHGESTTIPAGIAQQAGIVSAAVGAGSIADQHEVQGLLTTLENGNARVTARFPGLVRRLHVNVGDQVRAGQALATIESNLSLSTYYVSAPIAGTVLARDASVGQAISEGAALYEIADLSRLWVDLHVFGRDAEHLAPGSPVTIRRLGDGTMAETKIDRILPGTATASQSTVARATLDNSDGQWRPGSAVRAMVTVSLDEVGLMVPLTALQEDEGKDVVYVREGDVYSARKVALGRRDARKVEVLSGLKAGELVVVEQSYTVKADIAKSGATHEH